MGRCDGRWRPAAEYPPTFSVERLRKGGEWVFVAAVYDHGANAATLYVDESNVHGIASVTRSSRTLSIGKNLHGYVDDVFVFAGVLSKHEIEMLRKSAPPALPRLQGVLDIASNFLKVVS